MKALAAVKEDNPPERSSYHVIIGVLLSLLIKFEWKYSDYASSTSRRKGFPALPSNRKAPLKGISLLAYPSGNIFLMGSIALRPSMALATVSGGDHV